MYNTSRGPAKNYVRKSVRESTPVREMTVGGGAAAESLNAMRTPSRSKRAKPSALESVGIMNPVDR